MNNNRQTLKTVAVTVIITSILTFFATTWYLGGSQSPKLSATLSILNKYFYKDVDINAFDEKATKAAVTSLNDPYTEYMTSDEWIAFKSQLDAVYCGIGVVVTKEKIEDSLLIVSSFDDSPAKLAGLNTGDKITKVEGVATAGMEINDIVKKIKGAEGTKVKITVIKSNEQTENEIELTRSKINIETISTEMLDNKIGYIQLSAFNEGCSTKFINGMNDLINNGAESLIIDLRGNGGGLTKEAEAIANSILPKGSVIYSTKNKAGKTRIIKTTEEGNTIRIAVLVDGNTASASEILSAAIKENNRGVLVGSKTYGKGLVQTIVNFKDGSALKVTIEQYFTPSGTDINKQGITPDYSVELKSADDEQLLCAKTLLSQH